MLRGMLSGLIYRLSPARRRFMRSFGRPALARMEDRLAQAASGAAREFVSTLLEANLEYLAFAIFMDGPLARFAPALTVERTGACLESMLIYSVVQFAREEFFRNQSELIPLLAHVCAIDPRRVMLRRDQLRKAPRSEEWMLYLWIVADLGEKRPEHDPQLERTFAYGYLSYIGQYRPALERALSGLQS